MDEWSARKSKRNRRLLIAGGAVLFVAFVAFAFLEATSSPDFCASCHNMQPYVESWRTSSHNQVQCAQCHYEPGTWNYLKGKFTDGQVHLVMFMTGRTKGKYHAEISDLSCQECHSSEQLHDAKDFQGISFSHENHLGTMRREKKLRCVTCHGQLVQGEHLSVDPRDCFICHFKADENGARDPVLSDCRTCHKTVPSEIHLAEGQTFAHGRYIESGIACTNCHQGIIEGAGNVDFDHCMECHSERERTLKEIIKDKYTIESYHLNHVTNHKVECWRCHDVIKHEIVRNPTSESFETNCTVCHASNQHIGPRELYKGTGAIGVPDEPARMYLANVDCASCHVKRLSGPDDRSATDLASLVHGQACNDCHGPGYDAMLTQWRNLMFERETRAGARLVKAQNALAAAGAIEPAKKDEAAKLVGEAAHNVDFVRRARGHHNVQYAIKALEAAEARSEQALEKLTPGYTAQTVEPFTLNCTNLCHAEMTERKVKLGSVEYPHKKHVVDLGFECTMCHGEGAQHGVTNMVTCSGCHHGTGQGKVDCADCHQNIGNLTKGSGAAIVTGNPDPMNANIECVDCHVQTKGGQTTTLDGVKATCANCHDATYSAKADMQLAALGDLTAKLLPRVDAIQKVVDERVAKKENTTEISNRLILIRRDLDLVSAKRGQHNFEYAKVIAKEVESLLAEAEALTAGPH
ncbi:MAG: NapC/NirT family cytochrome c [Deltaproteobacteria bacterium]|nr:NapC/NirT family cytochrome c [Deltaproteobacteria bacterium]